MIPTAAALAADPIGLGIPMLIGSWMAGVLAGVVSVGLTLVYRGRR